MHDANMRLGHTWLLCMLAAHGTTRGRAVGKSARASEVGGGGGHDNNHLPVLAPTHAVLTPGGLRSRRSLPGNRSRSACVAHHYGLVGVLPPCRHYWGFRTAPDGRRLVQVNSYPALSCRRWGACPCSPLRIMCPPHGGGLGWLADQHQCMPCGHVGGARQPMAWSGAVYSVAMCMLLCSTVYV